RLHLVRQEFQQVVGVAHRVDDDHAAALGGAAQEVDRFDDRLFDQDYPVRVRVLIDEAVDDGGVAKPRVPADQAVRPVRVVDIVADVVGVIAEGARGGRYAGGDVARLLVHDDAAGPNRELVVHGITSPHCIRSPGYWSC